MLIFWISVTISELAFAPVLSGDPGISSTNAIAASAGLGAVDFLFVFVIRNKNRENNSEPGTQFSGFYSGFHRHADHCPSA
jgi:hypothetical protein